MANLSKAQIKEKLAKVLKSKDDCITIFGLQTKFGGGKTTGFALVYDSADAKKKYDQKTLLNRVSKNEGSDAVNSLAVPLVSFCACLFLCFCVSSFD